MQGLIQIFRTLRPTQLALIVGATLTLLASFAWLIIETGAPPYELLYGDLDLTDASRVVSYLDTVKIPYRIGPGGNSITVPADQVGRARVALAERGLPAGGSLGYEIFDRSDGLTTTNFQQNVNLVRALEGELARSIRAIETVRSARVHLVMPKRELFSRETPQPSASVLLLMRGTTRLTPPQVSAVQHLIASAVPGLTPERISIIDARGSLLTANSEGAEGNTAAGARADDRRLQYERHITRVVEDLISKTVGPDKVRAQVSAEMDFDRINTSEEIFNPDGQVVRSTQTVEAKSSNSDGQRNTAVSVAGNLPEEGASAADGKTTVSGNSDSRSEETVNYEISKKVVNHVRETGVVRRLSVAVLVDGTTATGADGTRTYQPRPQEELDRLTALVRSAIGFNAERGDVVEVVNMRFAEVDQLSEEPLNLIFGLEKHELLRIAQYVALFVFAVLVLLLVVRPLVARTIEAMPSPATLRGDLVTGPGQSTALPAPDQALAQIGSEVALGEDEEMIDLTRVEGRVKASSVRRVGEIVEKHPEETLSILRSWLYAEQ